MIIYTDGHCDGLNGIGGVFPNSGYTHILFKETNKELIINYRKKRLTNNEAEIMAVIHAFAYAQHKDTILTDSMIALHASKNGPRKKGAENLYLLKVLAHSLYRNKGVEIKWIRREDNPIT